MPSGKKAAQKMFYFFERKGIDLNLRYGIHYYGPYSAKLDNTLHILESEDYIDINTSSSTHVISMKCSTKEQIVNTFREIKGNKFSESIIEEAYRNLQEFGLIEVA